ncbi:MAG: DUF1343 domain-containing protein, partial [Flavobacteriaceae bacterium]|nr:DUF1343 domain-containing protein [Flavobacteriaceae bacterium]
MVLIFLFGLISCAKGSADSKRLKTSIVAIQKASDTMSYLDRTQPVVISQPADYLPLINQKVVGIVANQTSLVANSKDEYVHIIDTLLSLNIEITKVFSPEHGFRGEADAGEQVADDKDRKTGLPIISLHGKNKKPTSNHLKGIEIMIFDIQDVGVRFYTYISTLHYVMEACAEANIPLIVIDRPNPNAHYVDGPLLESKYKSFLGMHPVPLVYGMTIGEYALMINGEKWLKDSLHCTLTVMPIKNYDHHTVYSLPVRPSPNLPNDKAINLYPSLGLFEGTSINAGRGTDMQFQIFGAPFLDKKTYPFQFTPKSNPGAKYPKHKNKLCYGLDLREYPDLSMVNLQWLIDA